jgi:hypothetical protein
VQLFPNYSAAANFGVNNYGFIQLMAKRDPSRPRRIKLLRVNADVINDRGEPAKAWLQFTLFRLETGAIRKLRGPPTTLGPLKNYEHDLAECLRWISMTQGARTVCQARDRGPGFIITVRNRVPVC